MANKKTARRALFTSVISLILCCCMLVGTTFAWFTDSVTSANNKIQSGTLKIDLELLKDGTWTSIKDSNEPIFNYDLWEPGYTDVKVLKIENEGNLALKWYAKFQSDAKLSILADVIDVYVNPSATEIGYPADRNLDGYTKVGTLAEFVNTIESTTYGSLLPNDNAEGGDDVAYLGIALKMQETAGNDYQGLTICENEINAFDILILATQEMYEEDSFGTDYDKLAAFAGMAIAAKPAPGVSAVELNAVNEDGENVASAVVPAAAIAEDAENVKVNVDKSNYDGNFTVGADETALPVEVTVEGLKPGNTTPVKVTLENLVPAGKDPATVKLYHYDTEIPCTYDPETGYVTFESATFSPFTVVYQKDSVYVPPVADESKKPNAEVVYSPEYVNTVLPWGSYGQWSPTAGLDAKLEAAYTFSCTENLEQAKENPYANWHCDFYVKLDRELGANQIFLGGNYGSFGWVGFHNGDLTLAANEEVALLGSVTSNPWTYVDVVQNVGTFICGVGDVNDALADATFTVTLRLTNPDNASEYYDIETIEYTFTKVVNSGDELQDAVNNGNQNIELGGDIDLGNGGLIIP